MPIENTPLHPRDMPEPLPDAVFGAPGSCPACSAPPGYHKAWCAMRAASDRELRALRGAVTR